MSDELIVDLLAEARSRVQTVCATVREIYAGAGPSPGRRTGPRDSAPHNRTWRCTWLADGRYRDERDAGRTLIFDGSTQWQIGNSARTVMTTHRRFEPKLEIMVDPHWVVRDYTVTVTGHGELEGRPTLTVTAARRPEAADSAAGTSPDLTLVVDEATGILLAKRSTADPHSFVLSDVRINEAVDESTLTYHSASPGAVLRAGSDGSARATWRMGPRMMREVWKQRREDHPDAGA
jgi:hypothetical protein